MYSPSVELKPSTRVYCFLDLEHPVVAWAVMRGMLVSAKDRSVSMTIKTFNVGFDQERHWSPKRSMR